MENKKDWKQSVGKGCFDVLRAAFSPFSQKVEEEKDHDLIDPVNIKLFKIVGDGAQAYVYRASWKNREVACKVFKDEKEASISDLRKLLKLKHDNLISLKGIVERFPADQLQHTHLQGPGLVMEFCKMTLQDVIQNQRVPLGPQKILSYATEVCKGMKYLHSKRIIHRDLKSPNILVGFDNKLKISDLDSHARANPAEANDFSVRGTPNWMAPELIRAEKCCGKVDIWSFGVIIWELVTREEPYKNLNSNQIIFGVGSNRLKLTIPCKCSPNLAALMTSCWNMSPSYRPTFHRLEKMIQWANIDLEGVTIEQLEDDRSQWRKEINIALEDYKSAKIESNKARTQENWEEVAKLRTTLENIVAERIAGGDLSPENITRSFNRLPSSIRMPIIKAVAISPTSPTSPSPSSRRSARRRRQKRLPNTFGQANMAFNISSDEKEVEDSSDDDGHRVPRVNSGLRSKSSHHLRTSDNVSFARDVSSSDDANISSASPHSSTASENEGSTDNCLSDSTDSDHVFDCSATSNKFVRMDSVDEGFISSRDASARKDPNEKCATLRRITALTPSPTNRNNPFRNSSPV